MGLLQKMRAGKEHFWRNKGFVAKLGSGESRCQKGTIE